MKASSAGWFVGMLIVVGTLVACAGIDFGDVVQAKIPVQAQQDLGLPARMSYNESREVYEDWRGNTVTLDARWRENNDVAGEFAALLTGFSLQQIDEYGPMLGGVPVAGPALVGLSGLLSFWLGRSNQRREKEASYGKGRKDALEDAAKASLLAGRIQT